MDIVIFYMHIVGSYHLNFNNVRKIHWMIRWLLIYYGLWMSIVCDLMGHCSAQWRVKINSVCLSRTRFVIGGHFRQYILFAGLQLSIPRAIDISSIVCRRSFSVYRLSSIIYQLIFILHCHVYVGDWSTVAACWHRTCLVLRWDGMDSYNCCPKKLL